MRYSARYAPVNCELLASSVAFVTSSGTAFLLIWHSVIVTVLCSSMETDPPAQSANTTFWLIATQSVNNQTGTRHPLVGRACSVTALGLKSERRREPQVRPPYLAPRTTKMRLAALVLTKFTPRTSESPMSGPCVNVNAGPFCGWCTVMVTLLRLMLSGTATVRGVLMKNSPTATRLSARASRVRGQTRPRHA